MNIEEFLDNDIHKEHLKEFKDTHKPCIRKLFGKDFFSTTGGQFSYIITPSGLGNLVEIRCNACREVLDITNIENW